MTTVYSTSPTEPAERFISLDVLRGVAVLGILIMNIQSFAMPGAAYINPTAYGDLTGLNRWVWIFSKLFADGKFIAIFSILFGAGIILFTRRGDAKGRDSKVLHYRRMGCLFLFGLMHSYLLWTGDILVAYSLCGLFIFLLRNLKPNTLIWISAAFFIIPVIIYVFAAFSRPFWPEWIVDLAYRSWKPDEQAILSNLEAHRGTWLEQMKFRLPSSFSSQTKHFLLQTFWRVTAMMLLGMALFKLKILTAERGKDYYLKMALTGLISGLLLSILGVILNFKAQWSMEFSRLLGSRLNYIGSASMALGYIGVIMLIIKSSKGLEFKKLIAAVGRMAFTNYILMTLLATLIFYGHGLGLFGRVERSGQIGIVFGIWIVILLSSSLWLKHFRFGPLEALWRKITYWQENSRLQALMDKTKLDDNHKIIYNEGKR